MQNNKNKKFDGWLLYSDFDGTVYDEAITVEEKPRAKISDENKLFNIFKTMAENLLLQAAALYR